MIELTQTELAWAAGFYDGEGSTTSSNYYHQLKMGVSQSGEGALELLERFQKALGGLGSISGPRIVKAYKPIYSWSLCGFEKCQAVTAILWKYLGNVKRQQAKKHLSLWKNRASKDFRLSAYTKALICEERRQGQRCIDLAGKYKVTQSTIQVITAKVEPEFCQKGHPRTPENTRTWRRKPQGSTVRRCKICQAIAEKACKKRRKFAKMGL